MTTLRALARWRQRRATFLTELAALRFRPALLADCAGHLGDVPRFGPTHQTRLPQRVHCLKIGEISATATFSVLS